MVIDSPKSVSNVAERVCCDHCGQTVPPGLVEVGAERQFCCSGCRAVWETIRGCGLDAYYRLKGGEVTPAASPSGQSFEAFDAESFLNLYAHREGDLASIDLLLEGVSCGACVWLVERLPRLLEGVIEARLSLRDGAVRVTWDPSRVALSRVAQTLDRLGYTPHPARGLGRNAMWRREERRRLVHIGVAGAIAGNVMLLGLALYAGWFAGMEREYERLFRWISALLGAVALAWPGGTFFRSAVGSVRAGTLNLDVPIALALLVGGGAGLWNTLRGSGEIYFDSLCVLVFLLLVGRWMQFRQQRRAGDAVELLFSLTPATCRIVDGESVREAPVEAIRPGSLVEVRAGELIPADGVVESGESSVNQALLSGEATPTPVAAGSRVYAGAQNVDGPVRVRVEGTGAATRIGRLMRLVEAGASAKPRIIELTDRIGAWFVLGVSLAAAGVFVGWLGTGLSRAVDHTVALLIVTCPCVLGLATPLTLAVAMGRLARRNILVKSGAAIERLSRPGQMLLDKTGTLTMGRMSVTAWEGDSESMALAGAVEAHATHPVGRAIAEYAGPPTLRAQDLRETAGGILGTVAGRQVRIGSARFTGQRASADSSTTAFVVVDGRLAATVRLGDAIRPDSAAAVAAIREAGWSVQVVSGDSAAAARRVAEAVGIEQAAVRGDVTPEEKLAAVSGPRGRGPTVMVGDGVNDAAALAAADVGIAVHGGAEASLAAADVYVASPGLSALARLMATSRKAMRVVRRNLMISLAYNLAAGGLAAAGYMHPLIAAIVMPLSSATVLATAIASMNREPA